MKIETDSITSYSSSSAVLKSKILDLSEAEINDYGHCWSTNENPTINLKTKTTWGERNERGVFIDTVYALIPNTTYYIRAYITEGQVTTYGNQVSFTSDMICDGASVFCDDFSNSNLTDNWILSGDPLPIWVDNTFGRTGLFDNNGDPNYASNAYSKKTTAGSGGFILEAELYLCVVDTDGCWLDASIGLTKQENPIPSFIDLESGLLFGLVFTGKMCWGTPNEYNYHAFLDIYLFAEDNTACTPGNMVFYADDLVNGWHIFKILVQPDRFVKFYIDNSLIWISSKKIHPDLMMNKNILLGRRSSGYGGKSYIDWIKYNESKSDSVLIEAAPVASFIASPTIISSGGIIQFTDQSTYNPTSWGWDFGDGGTSSLRNPTHTYGYPGTYSVSLTVANEYGTDMVVNSNYINVIEIDSGSFTDARDGHVYKWVKIGSQTWMAENLSAKKFGDNTTISNIKVYDDNENNTFTYGRLYDWYSVVDIRGVCPIGWHIPADSEWTILTDYLGGESNAGGKLKESGTVHWEAPNVNATNESGFTALPGGSYEQDFGSYAPLGAGANFWTSSQADEDFAKARGLFYGDASILNWAPIKSGHFSIRCIKD